MPGLMEELNLKPGVIYGDDVLNVRSGLFPAAPRHRDLTISDRLLIPVVQLCPEEGIRDPSHQRDDFVHSVSVLELPLIAITPRRDEGADGDGRLPHPIPYHP